MRNPWLDIPLADYEGHMMLSEVGQARLLSDVFGQVLDRYAPRSVALVGCAGGNGLEQTLTRSIERVVGIDINPDYVEQTRNRFGARIPSLELFVGDVQTDLFPVVPVDLAFAGLLFEHVDIAATLSRIRELLVEHGTLVAVLQLPHASSQEITPSRFTSLGALSSVMRLVSSDELGRLAQVQGLRTADEWTTHASGGKQFRVIVFQA